MFPGCFFFFFFHICFLLADWLNAWMELIEPTRIWIRSSLPRLFHIMLTESIILLKPAEQHAIHMLSGLPCFWELWAELGPNSSSRVWGAQSPPISSHFSLSQLLTQKKYSHGLDFVIVMGGTREGVISCTRSLCHSISLLDILNVTLFTLRCSPQWASMPGLTAFPLEPGSSSQR